MFSMLTDHFGKFKPVENIKERGKHLYIIVPTFSMSRNIRGNNIIVTNNSQNPTSGLHAKDNPTHVQSVR